MQFTQEFAVTVKTIRHGLIMGLSTLMSLAGCSSAEDADRTSVLPSDEFHAYCAAFKATGAKFWIDRPEQILDRPDEALKALSAAKKLKVNPEKLLAASRQGPYVFRENERRIGQLIEVARHARQKRIAEARAALDKYRKDLEDAWPNCWRKEYRHDEGQ